MVAAVNLLQGILCVLLILTCLLLIGVILLQKGRGGGLSSAFGGGGQSAFGSKTGDVLTWFTVSLAGAFLLLGVVGNHAFDRSTGKQLAVPAQQPAGGTTPPGTMPASATPATQEPAAVDDAQA